MVAPGNTRAEIKRRSEGRSTSAPRSAGGSGGSGGGAQAAVDAATSSAESALRMRWRRLDVIRIGSDYTRPYFSDNVRRNVCRSAASGISVRRSEGHGSWKVQFWSSTLAGSLIRSRQPNTS